MMRRICATVLVLLSLTGSCWATVDTGALPGALPGEAEDALSGVSPQEADLKTGLAGLWETVCNGLWSNLKEAASVGFLILAASMLLALAVGFSASAGIRLPEKLPDLTGVCVILTIYFSAGSSLINQCRSSMENLDNFIKILTPVYAAASAVAGRPVSAVTCGEITLLFSAVVLWLSQTVVLPGISIYVLMKAIGGLMESGLLVKLAELLKWGISKSMKWTLIGFTAYQTLSGMITRSTDAFTVKTAQAAISSMIPVIGTVISGTSDTILGGAAILRTSIGIYGFLAVCAICLVPLARAAVHFVVFKLLAACSAGYLGGPLAGAVDGITDAYGMAVGALGMCCLVQFISIVVSSLVTGT